MRSLNTSKECGTDLPVGHTAEPQPHLSYGPKRATNPHAVFTQAIAAVALPTVVLLFSQTAYCRVLSEKAVESPKFRWLCLALGVALFVLEIRCLTTAARLVRAGGRVAVLRKWETDPIKLVARRRWRFRMIAAACSSLLAFGLAEVTFRVFDIRPTPSPPSTQHDWDAVDNTLNSLGIREKWDSIPDDDRRLRIAFLGDSITYGDNVEPQQTFCALVGQLLTADRSEGVLTINLGFRGTSPGWQLEKFLPVSETLNPDVVVHVVYLNDLGINMHHRLDEIYRWRDGDLWLGDGSYVLRYAERQVRYWGAWKRTIDYFRGGRNSTERAAAWAKFKSDVSACKAAVEQGGATYALVLFPWLVRLDDYALTDVHTTMREFALQLGVPYLDLLEIFAGRDAETLRVSLANEHPNALGHRLAAERIARFVRDEVLPLLDR